MKKLLFYIFALISISGFSQEKDQEKQELMALKKANNFVYEGNEKAVNNDFVSAEMAYRKALSQQATSVAGAYNLGTSYYQEGSYNEALYRLQQATKNATSKEEKHKAFHNIGNILMKENKCQEAVDAYKNALRNNPSDNETRYNLALAKKCAEDQKDEQQDDNKDDQNKDQNQDQEQDQNQDGQKDDQDKQDEGENKDDNQDQGDQDKKDGDDQKDDQGKPKEDKKGQGKGDDQKKDQQPPQPQPGQLSPQQVKNLLEAMNNQEQKVQEKINAEKQKGVKVQTEKDW
ncbi:MAG: tetratricopeptide repeat protein [Xanthomarina gelatinilytica]|uniref:tetratricopeptide repeat protein n=1 Tax=Xanthomarina gelatinilytica TaxID=1137281 RepID=UPI003A86B16F